jgi:hypothetical protein
MLKRERFITRSLIDDRLNGSSGAEDAVSNLYQDHGYLFSRLTPVESKIDHDSIDLEVRIYEGDQAYLNNVLITGNTRTNEHIARRELYTLPGDLFSKTKIIRSIRQLGVLGHFDPEKINPTPFLMLQTEQWICFINLKRKQMTSLRFREDGEQVCLSVLLEFDSIIFHAQLFQAERVESLSFR